MRPLIPAALTACILACILILGCDSCVPPCGRLADRTCAAQGNGSENCIEIRRRAELATDEDQRYCTEAMAIIDHRREAKNEPDGR